MRLTDNEYKCILALHMAAEDYQSEDPTPGFQYVSILLASETLMRGYPDTWVAYSTLILGNK